MHTTLKGRVDISTDGNEWLELPGVSQVSIRSAPAATRERRDFNKVITLLGRPGTRRVDVTIPALVVGDRSYTVMEDAFQDGSDVWVRVSYPERLIATPSAAAQVISIDADTGLVTLSAHGEHVNFLSPAVSKGKAIRTDSGQYFVIQSISDTGVVHCYTDGAGTGTTGYRVVVPAVRTAQVQCTVRHFGDLSADANDYIGTSAQFQPHDGRRGALTLGGFV